MTSTGDRHWSLFLLTILERCVDTNLVTSKRKNNRAGALAVCALIHGNSSCAADARRRADEYTERTLANDAERAHKRADYGR